MAKQLQKTRVIVAGEDVSSAVKRVNILREPNEPDKASVEVFVDRIRIADDGTMLIYVAEDLIA